MNDVEEAIARLLSLHDIVNPTGYVAGGSYDFAPHKLVVCSSTPTKGIIASTLNDADDLISGELAEILNETPKAAQLSAPPSPHVNIEEDLRDVRQKTPNAPKENVFQKLLEKQTVVQEELFTDIRNSLNNIEIKLTENVSSFKEIKNSMKNMNDHLKESARFQRKLFNLKEKQLEMLKLQMERDEKQRLQENSLKIMDMEIRKRQLDIEERKMNLMETNNN